MTIERAARYLAGRFRSNIYDADDLAQDAYVAQIMHPWKPPRWAMIDGLRRFYPVYGKHNQFRQRVHMPLLVFRPDMVRTVLRDELIRCVRRLPRQHRLVMIYYYWHGHRGRKIAKIMGYHESRISQLRGEAIRYLQYMMEAR